MANKPILIDPNELEGYEFKTNTVYALSGVYKINNSIKILVKNVTLIGDGTVVIEKPINNYGIFVNQGADGFCMLNITIKEMDHWVGYDKNITAFPCLEVQANDTLVQYCTFSSVEETTRSHLPSVWMTVFYTYPPAQQGEPNTVVSNYFEGTILCTNNIFANNTVQSQTKKSCDNFSFSLQRNGLVCQNQINGMLAVFMCKDTKVRENNITCLNNHALYISLPSNDITIRKNNLESKDEYSTIKIQQQHDQANPDEFLGEPYARIGAKVCQNLIMRKRCGIEMCNDVFGSKSERKDNKSQGKDNKPRIRKIHEIKIDDNIFNLQDATYKHDKYYGGHQIVPNSSSNVTYSAVGNITAANKKEMFVGRNENICSKYMPFLFLLQHKGTLRDLLTRENNND